MEEPVTRSPSIHEMSARILVPLLVSESDNIQRRRLNDRFYNLFKDEIWIFCRNAAFNIFGHTADWEEVAQEIHSDAFRIALDKIATFKLEKDCLELKAHNTVRKWISKIANNLLLRHISNSVKEKSAFNAYKEFVEMRLDQGPSARRVVEKKYDEKKFNQVWIQLSPFAKEIVLLSYEHDCFPTLDKKNKKHLPTSVLEELCKKYDTDNDNYRKTKERAFKKILDCSIQ